MGQTWLFFVILGIFGTTTCKRAIREELEEPHCYSRFDYDYKVIHHLVTLKEAETELRETITQLQERVSHLEKTATTEVKDPLAVGFSAHLKNRFVSKEPSIIRFNHVLGNTGNGYDVHTGIFVATVAGLYSFTIDIASAISSRAYIMFNGMYVGYCFITGVGGKWESCTQTVALQLNIGDKVWAAGIGQIEGYEEHKCKNRGDQCYHSTFTGFKVQSL